MRSPIFTIPSGSTDSFQDHENDTIEADDGHDEDDLLDFAVSGQNGSILDEALTHVAQRARPGSSSAASTLKPQSAAVMVHRLSASGEPSMTEEPEEVPRPEEVGSPLAVVDAAAAEETRLKANIRRYYALMELFETEKGYLNDLRVLVEVCSSFLSHHIFLLFPPNNSSSSLPHAVFCPTSALPRPFSITTRAMEVRARVGMFASCASRHFNRPLAKVLEDPAKYRPRDSRAIRVSFYRPGSSPQKLRAAVPLDTHILISIS